MKQNFEELEQMIRVLRSQYRFMYESEQVSFNQQFKNIIKSYPVQDFEQLKLDESLKSLSHEEIESIFRKVIGFLPKDNQELIIATILDKKSDMMCILPSAYGKSALFQVSSQISQGLTVVIMPLLSIVFDQKQFLKRKNIQIYAYTSDNFNKADFLNFVKNGGKLIYTTPESLDSLLKQLELKEIQISQFFIDEAHCILWSNFRKAFLNLGTLKNKFPQIPIIALTATASKNVQAEIVQTLRLKSFVFVQEPAFRKNLIFVVKEVEKKTQFIYNFLKQNPNKSGIIYCTTKKQCLKLQQDLLKLGTTCEYYYASLSTQKRDQLLSDWIDDKIRVLISTVALGLGINKSNVNFVIHYAIPLSLDCYLQQCGRAGRDGSDAECILLYKSKDVQVGKRMAYADEHENMFYDIYAYCLTSLCRVSFQSTYLGENINLNCKRCDNCKLGLSSGTINDFTEESKQIIAFLKQPDLENKTLKQLIDFLRFKRANSEIQIAGLLQNFNNTIVELLLVELIRLGFLYEKSEQSLYGCVYYIRSTDLQLENIDVRIPIAFNNQNKCINSLKGTKTGGKFEEAYNSNKLWPQKQSSVLQSKNLRQIGIKSFFKAKTVNSDVSNDEELKMQFKKRRRFIDDQSQADFEYDDQKLSKECKLRNLKLVAKVKKNKLGFISSSELSHNSDFNQCHNLSNCENCGKDENQAQLLICTKCSVRMRHIYCGNVAENEYNSWKCRSCQAE